LNRDRVVQSDITKMMVTLLVSSDDEIRTPGITRTIYCPVGPSGVLSEVKGHLLKLNPTANISLFGPDNENGQSVSHLRQDPYPQQTFDYLLALPTADTSWKGEEEHVYSEALRDSEGRFLGGLPPASDSQLLYVELMLSKMHKLAPSRVVIATDERPLFRGGLGSGSAAIRGWIEGNDFLEAIVPLPKEKSGDGQNRYLWSLGNAKARLKRAG
jgi:type I restriction enzyme M protein